MTKILNHVNKNWVVAQLKPNMYLKAERHLKNQSFEFFAPKREETIRSKNLFRKIKKLLFPGYIFVKININSKDVLKINSTYGISSLLRRSDHKIGVLPEEFIKNLKKLSDVKLSSKLKKIVSGTKVKCIDGPFVGIVGEIINLDYNGRLKILFRVLENHRIVTLESRKVEVI